MSVIGHNKPPRAGGIAADRLQSIIQRIERLTEEKQAIQEDISDVFAEARGNGFDVKTIRTILKLRQKDDAKREEEEALLHTYMRAMGMILEEDGRED